MTKQMLIWFLGDENFLDQLNTSQTSKVKKTIIIAQGNPVDNSKQSPTKIKRIQVNPDVNTLENTIRYLFKFDIIIIPTKCTLHKIPDEITARDINNDEKFIPFSSNSIVEQQSLLKVQLLYHAKKIINSFCTKSNYTQQVAKDITELKKLLRRPRLKINTYPLGLNNTPNVNKEKKAEVELTAQAAAPMNLFMHNEDNKQDDIPYVLFQDPQLKRRNSPDFLKLQLQPILHQEISHEEDEEEKWCCCKRCNVM